MKKVVLMFVGAAVLAAMGVTEAADSMTASNQSYSSYGSVAGVYVSGYLGWGKFDVSQAPNTTGFKNDGFAWNGNLGYQYNRYVAAELGYNSFSDTTQTFNGPGSIAGRTSDTFGVDFLVKGILPICSKFNVFAKAGAMFLHTKLSGGAFNNKLTRYVPEFGVGAGYNLTRNIAIEAQGLTTLAVKGHGAAQSITDVTMPATYLALAGVSYKFNA